MHVDAAVQYTYMLFVEDRAGPAEPSWKAQNLLAAYTPGDMPSVFPPGVAKRIPRGIDLLFEVHYTTIGKARFDQSRTRA